MYLNLETILAILLMACISLYFRILLQILGQTWVKTIAHTATLMLLPILTFIITNVISGNIALSLGMVGALSIVRFRNPVRSPLELSVYFGAITMGITAAVSLKWLLLLFMSVTFVAIFLSIINVLSSKLTKAPFFISSFAEGNNLASLVVISEEEISLLENNESLISKSITGSERVYTLAHSQFSLLKKLEADLQANSAINSMQLNR